MKGNRKPKVSARQHFPIKGMQSFRPLPSKRPVYEKPKSPVIRIKTAGKAVKPNLKDILLGDMTEEKASKKLRSYEERMKSNNPLSDTEWRDYLRLRQFFYE